jgi:hypothetical protein
MPVRANQHRAGGLTRSTPRLVNNVLFPPENLIICTSTDSRTDRSTVLDSYRYVGLTFAKAVAARLGSRSTSRESLSRPPPPGKTSPKCRPDLSTQKSRLSWPQGPMTGKPYLTQQRKEGRFRPKKRHSCQDIPAQE